MNTERRVKRDCVGEEGESAVGSERIKEEGEGRRRRGVQRKGMAGFCGWLDVDQSKAERNHSLMESAQHDFMFSGALAKGRERQ